MDTSTTIKIKNGGLVAAMLGAAAALAMGGGACGEAPTGSDDTQVVQSAITTITISGKVTKTGNVAVPNIPIRLNGKSQAWALTNATGNYSFPGLATGSYSVRPEAAGCTFSPDVVNLNNLTTNKTQNFTVSGAMCTGPTSAAKAMILVDSRLYAQLTTQIDQYKELAEARRGFNIDLRKTEQFDSWTFAAVKSYIVSARQANPAIEGVLFIGNIKLPSFYKARIDTGLTRLYPRYYEDLDGMHSKRYATGEIDPVCPPSFPDGDTKCIISPRADGGSGPVTVIAHDFDDTNFGPNPGPEIWTSYMPVGVAGSANTYVDFGNQLRPYFQKLARFYNHEFVSNRRYYYVSNDKGEQFGQVWNAWGKNNIDFYGRPGPNGEVNNELGDGCFPGGGVNLCYSRWNVESYPTADAFITAYNNQPWTGEGWQWYQIFLSHMNAALYDVTDVAVHSTPTDSLIHYVDVKFSMTNGGLIAASSGCSVGAFAQPGAPATTGVDITTMPSENIMLAYLYGTSKAVASTGDPHWRGHYAHFPTMYESLKLGGNAAYLGAANKARLDRLYAQSPGNKWELKENSAEMLFGDPFMDLRP